LARAIPAGLDTPGVAGDGLYVLGTEASGKEGCARVRSGLSAPESWNWSRRAGFLRVVLPASVQCRKGISSVLVRLRPLLPTLLAISSLALSGCSNNSDRVTGNERLIRGAGGLGSTLVETTIPDRDTYVTPGTANYGSVLLVGRDATFEARAFFKILKINLPSTDFIGVVPTGNVLLDFPHIQLRNEPFTIDLELRETATALADSGTISWPGPAPGVLLASSTYDFTGDLIMDLGPGSYSRVAQWTAPEPDSIPTLMLQVSAPQGFAAFASRTARLRIPFTKQVAGTTVPDTVSTTVRFDLYLHPPLIPAATGSDTALVLGGPFESRIAIRGPIPAMAPGASINDLRLVFGVIDSIPGYVVAADSIAQVPFTIEIYQVTGTWPETATDGSQVPTGSTPVALVVRSFPVGDTLSIPLPPDLARGWTTLNEGVVLGIRNANVKPGLRLGSHESALVPLLRVGTTSAPPGRF
jgi:hypothetical protein